jgi:hypothetical protein
MKIIPEHYEQLRVMVTEKLETIESLEPFFDRYQKNGGDWKMRFRWDLLYTIPYEIRQVWFDEVYQYANDEHIDTALRKIMKGYM